MENFDLGYMRASRYLCLSVIANELLPNFAYYVASLKFNIFIRPSLSS